MVSRPRTPHTLLFILLLIVAAVLRVQVIRAIPDFFGPGDPAIYFQMARGTLHHGWPRMEFIHHFLARPPGIVHAEDYYEPAFGYLVAPALLVGGEKPAAAAAVSLVFGLLAVFLVSRLARRHGPDVALIAAAIVAFEPWSIYYSGLLMKEATVTVVVLAFLELLRRGAGGSDPPGRAGLVLGAATVAAGLLQYELIPIAGLAGIVVLAVNRRAALPGYLLGAGLCLAALTALTWVLIGVPISAKYAFALGQSLGDPDRLAPVRDFGQSLRALFPFRYIGWAIVSAWYPPLILLAALGAAAASVSRVERTILLAFGAAFLCLHAIPQDLWCRDFIPMTAVLATPAALAFSRAAPWRARTWSAPVAWAMALGLAVNFWLLLPYPAIYLDAPYPNYEIERAHRQRVGDWLRRSVPPGPVLAEVPAEIALYSGFPAVALPTLARQGTLERLAARYRVRYLLVEPGALPDGMLRTLHLRAVGECEGSRLFSF